MILRSLQRIHHHYLCQKIVNVRCARQLGHVQLDIDGHVVTTDPSGVRNEFLRSLFVQGAKYRTEFHLNGVREAVREGLAEYAKACGRYCGPRIDELERWAAAFMHTVEERIRAYVPTATAQPFLESNIGAKEETP